jgi:hypothetical protein
MDKYGIDNVHGGSYSSVITVNDYKKIKKLKNKK